jgi:hypothetical protein
MRTTRLSFLLLSTLAAIGCKSTSAEKRCCEACEQAQAVVERVARENPSVTRLTVHCTPPKGGAPMACASTSADKRGKPSDPEDLRAMQSGRPEVMEEGTALDVTVPIMQKDGRYTGACGVTLKPEGTREATIERARSIAMAVETDVKKNGTCACETCCHAK